MIALFGGSFSPIHNGHLAMADEVAYCLDLEKIIFVVAADPPHKESLTLLPFTDRVAMAKLATNQNSRFAVSDIEKMCEGKSYTIDMINYFRKKLGDEPLFLVGWDAFLDIPNWHKAEELVTTCNIAVMDRRGEQQEPFADVVTKLLKTMRGIHDFKIVSSGVKKIEKLVFNENKNFITIVPVPRLDISSSDIRRRLETGKPVRYLVPESVMEFMGEKSE